MRHLQDTRITILTPQLPVVYRNGGIGTFTRHFVRLLHRAGFQHLHLIYCSPLEQPRSAWEAEYTQMGVRVSTIYRYQKPFEVLPGFDEWQQVSNRAWHLIDSETDLIYCADWRANAMIAAQSRRYQAHHTPLIATVMHGPAAWGRQNMRLLPSWVDELRQEYQERYAVEHSDYLATPSAFTFDWALTHHWALPPEPRRFALGCPWLPAPEATAPPAPLPSNRFRHLIFFGRVETRKGIYLLLDALAEMCAARAERQLLSQLDTITLIGQRGLLTFGPIDGNLRALTEATGVPVIWHDQLNSTEAQAMLHQHAGDSLVVLPSLSETFGYSLVEASLIPGLNVIASTAGGMESVLGEAATGQYFEPTVSSLRQALRQWLEQGPRPAGALTPYDWQAANRRWLDFNTVVCEAALERRKRFPKPPLEINRNTHVDVIVPYYNLGQYLPYTLQSLAEQSTDDFSLLVVDDGSTDAESQAVFAAMRERYAGKPRWRFVQQTNQGVEAARNLGVLLTDAPYLLFMDADNVATRQMVEIFRNSIVRSGDDLLWSWQYTFTGDGSPFLGGSQVAVPKPAYSYLAPLGNAPILNLLTTVFGDNNAIMRRSAFEAVGGFRRDARNLSQEDHELFTEIVLAGYKADVIPEFLYYYRYRDDSRHRVRDEYVSEMRVLRVYEKLLQQYNLGQLPYLMLGLYYSRRDFMTTQQLHNTESVTHLPIFTNPDGTRFRDQQDYLVNGVAWHILLRSLLRKLKQRLRRGRSTLS